MRRFLFLLAILIAGGLSLLIGFAVARNGAGDDPSGRDGISGAHVSGLA